MSATENLVARTDLRNVAIIAHVDHGKTTLVDAMLWQSGAFRSNETVAERVMDSMDLEREKGITILAKNTAVRYVRDSGKETKINIVDTPGHSDFGGEVERALTMVDGVLLLVDSSEGPLPQTRFVLRKALELQLPVVLVINKIDRPDARIADVVDEVYELFLDLDATDNQIDFPIVYTNARQGTATLDLGQSGTDLRPMFETLLETVPAPLHDPEHPLQAWVTNLDSSPYVGRIAMCRVMHGTIKRGQNVAWCRTDGTTTAAKINELYVTESLDRVDADEASAGEIIAISGIEDITIGETLADLANPVPLPLITVDEPSLSITIGINTSPMAGLDGAKVTARLIKNRLDAELIGNVSVRVLDTERRDTWEVQGRGELQLAVLVEIMRREGFEMTVGKPKVVTRTIDGKLHEPTERVTIDIPESSVGAVTQLLGERKADMVAMSNHGTGWVRLDYIVAARGLIGFRTEFLTETRGTGLMANVFEDYTPWLGELRTRHSGSIVADRKGSVTGYAVAAVQERASLFVAPGEEVYEGMVIGENPRTEDMDVNICREKKQTNVRAAASDDTIRLTPPRVLSLEQALEFIGDDECVEVTPNAIRLRKTVFDATARGRARKRLQRTSLAEG
ncbi:translational GTPase TypA [Candidatus Poriferisodalis sp.]|uniref:translational GTPase TypA n=1 Tax=Candidatus Poriferisodalis sp. TaxID=3101277 RepID=UPI003B01C105